MDEKEIENWQSITHAKLFVGKEFFHHHAFEILNTHSSLRAEFVNSLNSKISIEPRIKRTGSFSSKAIKADYLNVELRVLLKNIPNKDVKLEVNEERGVFYFSSEKSTIGGFDFAIINHAKNLMALRNLCFGELHYHDGLKRWNQFLEKNADLKSLSADLLDTDLMGMDMLYTDKEKEVPLIVGEVQFGNWALVYRDFFKVLKANVQNSVDCLIYIVPTGSLENMLSDGIVTFDTTVKILKEFAKVISVPVWVVGIDLEA